MMMNFAKTMAMLLIIFVLVIPGIAAAVLDQSTTVAVKQTKALTVSEPTFKEYRGVKIGMTATDVRQKLGDPKIKDKAQEIDDRLARVKRVRIGMGNYQDVMNAYNEMFDGIIDSVKELATVVSALVPPVDRNDEGKP